SRIQSRSRDNGSNTGPTAFPIRTAKASGNHPRPLRVTPWRSTSATAEAPRPASPAVARSRWLVRSHGRASLGRSLRPPVELRDHEGDPDMVDTGIAEIEPLLIEVVAHAHHHGAADVLPVEIE